MQKVLVIGNIGRAEEENPAGHGAPAGRSGIAAARNQSNTPDDQPGHASVAGSRAAPDLDFSRPDVHRIAQARSHLSLLGLGLARETTASGSVRYLVTHRGWFRPFDTLDDVFEFLRGCWSMKTEAPIKNVPLPRRGR
ncbi:hypothetical protein [Xenophilus azovorans]|uniref:hypothetical protein n=1 Tax=Xenophilus azovorans TaxID=151755 RepID=UPI00056E1702|nr:hypothetical protein [Xenophilus azovorans]